uniref:putative pentatricopeptide repeat-containing protein At1g74400 n=1 Tax=Erigeron canadensis TaxID=72917 RepID=UPI001CB8A413|nr:putative pentatricopeptide repeat-containing protein At1g74400 [Erigeron canadensis]
MRFMKFAPLVQNHKVFPKCALTKPSHFHNLNNRTKPRPNELLKQYLNTNDTSTKALLLFRDLIRKNTSKIDSFSLLYMIKICARNSSSIHDARPFHTLVVKLGYKPIIFIQTSLVSYYSCVGNLADAHQVFDEMPTKNVVSWTVLISAYVDNQKPKVGLKLFEKMQMENVAPDHVTLTVALSACADLGALDTGKWIHNLVRRNKNIDKDLSLYNALLNMYTKCGDIGTAKILFHDIKHKDVTTYTSMITGYAIHGQAKEALALFKTMIDTKIVPNDVTFIGVLMACSHVSMVDDGKQYFKKMINRYRLKPRLSHYGCMVDLLCRAGCLQEAKDFILEMPMKPNAVIWRTLLSACSIRGDIDLAEEARGRLVEFEESLAGDDVIMSNVYASKGIWEKKEIVRDRVNERRIPGRSWIEIGNEINEFVAADNEHIFTCNIYEIIESLKGNMRGFECSFD